MDNRINITDEDISKIMSILLYGLNKRIKKHGTKSFISKHEILGVLAEEWTEINLEIKNDANLDNYKEELIDIAVVCVWGLASLLHEEE